MKSSWIIKYEELIKNIKYNVRLILCKQTIDILGSGVLPEFSVEEVKAKL